MRELKIPHFGLARQYQLLKDELLDATHSALSSGQLVDGPFTHKFENWLVKKTRAIYALTVHSGTQALEIMAKCELHCVGKEFFEEPPVVALPNISYPATLNAFLNAGFQVKLCDTDGNGILAYPNFDFDYVCTVGLYGAETDNADYPAACLFVDGAQHWLVEKDIGLGMAISFDPTKNLPSSGNGGAIVTNNEWLYETALSYKNNGKPDFDYLGTNSKMSEQDCAQLLVRTNYLDDWQKRRKKIRMYYLDKFKNLPIRCLSRNIKKHSDQKFVIYYENRDALFYHLLRKGVEVKIHYEEALSELPISRTLVKPTLISTSVMLCRGVLSLPIYPELSDTEVEYIADTVCNYFIVE